MKILTFALAGLLLSATPLFASAETYSYVDASGDIQVVTAETPQEAIATAYNRAHDSGVMLIGEPQAVALASSDANTETYLYITVSGEISTQVAESPMEAIRLAPNRATHSGVVLVAGS